MKKDVLKTIKNDMWDVLSNKKYLQAQIKTALREIEADRKEALVENASIEGVSSDGLTFWNQRTNEAYDRKRVRVVTDLIEQYHNSQSYYLIYKDGSCVSISAEDILSGEKFPKVSDVVYAQMLSADEWVDTEVGDIDAYFGQQVEDYDASSDEALEMRDQYEIAVEFKFGTAWSARYAQNNPGFVPAAL